MQLKPWFLEETNKAFKKAVKKYELEHETKINNFLRNSAKNSYTNHIESKINDIEVRLFKDSFVVYSIRNLILNQGGWHLERNYELMLLYLDALNNSLNAEDKPSNALLLVEERQLKYVRDERVRQKKKPLFGMKIEKESEILIKEIFNRTNNEKFWFMSEDENIIKYFQELLEFERNTKSDKNYQIEYSLKGMKVKRKYDYLVIEEAFKYDVVNMKLVNKDKKVFNIGNFAEEFDDYCETLADESELEFIINPNLTIVSEKILEVVKEKIIEGDYKYVSNLPADSSFGKTSWKSTYQENIEICLKRLFDSVWLVRELDNLEIDFIRNMELKMDIIRVNDKMITYTNEYKIEYFATIDKNQVEEYLEKLYILEKEKLRKKLKSLRTDIEKMN